MCSAASREAIYKAETDFKYPVVYIELGLPTLVEISSETSINTRKSSFTVMASQQTTIPLGESSYDLIQNSNDVFHEEEDFDDNTGSLASVDELESLTGTDFSINTGSADSDAESIGIPAFVGLDQGRGSSGDIASSSTTTAFAPEQTSHSIEFDEVDMIGTEHVTVSRTIRHFNESEAASILGHLNIERSPAHLISTLKETLAKSRLAIDGSFQVLYAGDPSAKDDIVGKVASALAAPLVGANPNQVHLRSSRFSVIPISDFGSRQIPTIELVDSFGVELVVDHCTTARTTKSKDSADILHLQLNNSVWISSKYDGTRFFLESPATWRLPHVAILFWGETDNADERKSLRYTRAFLARHDIPCISISRNGSFERQNDDFASPDPHSIHMCLEVRTSAGQENRILKRFPVELSTFLSLDPRQMNRNLAFLTGQQLDQRGLRAYRRTKSELSVRRASYRDTTRWFPYFKQRQIGWLQSVLSFAVAVISLSSLIYLLANTEAGRMPRRLGGPSYITDGMTSVSICSMSKAHDGILPSSTREPVSVTTPAAAESQTASAETRALAGPMADLASLLYDPTATSLNKSDRFELHVIGDCHMILKPSRHFGKLRRPPPLFVKATRNGSLIPVKFSKLFDGVYALHLNPEDAHSLVDILVWTESRPVIKENFELDFGTPWLKIASWRKAATKLSSQVQKDLVRATGSLGTALNHVSTDVMAVYSQAAVQASRARQRFSKVRLSDIQKSLPFQGLELPHVRPTVKAIQSSVPKDLIVYKDKVASMVANRAYQLYNAAPPANLAGLWQDLHFVHPRDILSEAQRHARILWARHVAQNADEVEPRMKSRKGFGQRRRNANKSKSR